MIKENSNLILKNVVSFRGKVTRKQMQQEMLEIKKLREQSILQKNAPIVTTTYTVEQVAGQQILEVEILVPVDRDINVPDKYNIIDRFEIIDAIYTQHQGGLSTLGNAIKELNRYIKENGKDTYNQIYNVMTDNMCSKHPQTIFELYMVGK